MLFAGAAAALFYDDDTENVPSFVGSLSPEERRSRDRRLPRCAIRSYEESPFKYLYDSGDNQALLNVTGCTYLVFEALLEKFEPLYNKYRPNMQTGQVEKIKFGVNGGRPGKPRDLDAVGCLGLVLLWYRTRGAVSRGLAMTFGLTSSPMIVWLKFGRRVLITALQEDDYARVSIPTQEEIDLYTCAIGAKYPVLAPHKVWGAADGLKLPIQAAGDDRVQNNFYNGWIHGHYVNNVFVFAPDGRIRVSVINAPGAWHDSTIADYGVYSKIDQVHRDHGGKVVVDSAFQLGDRPCLIKSAQIDPIGEPIKVATNRAATSVRQLSEWGMRMIQAQFPRLKDPMLYEEYGERRVILHLMVLLYNFNCSYVGINQILNSYLEQNLSDDREINYYDQDYPINETANDFLEGNIM